ncbi:MAG TPA: T9SS type A sorting domain-containing protein, partial [Ignavibacteriaceae bacterium]|nr:T9SS type A sorting domain-containing protein [Ignavibacteriaceae bacterium]
WSTATETNNQGFEIQRKSVNRQFESIGFVKGYGTTTQRHQYSYVDNNILNGKFTYRLRQIDFDGSFTYSKEVEIDVNNPLQFTLSQNYPNPFNPITKIKYSVPSDGQVSLTVYNAIGQKVSELVNGEVKVGSYEVSFDASDLSSGVYLYKIQANGYTSTKKMILLR